MSSSLGNVLLLLWLLLFSGSANHIGDDFLQSLGAGGPLSEKFSLVAAAGQAVLDGYNNNNSLRRSPASAARPIGTVPGTKVVLTATTRTDGSIKSAVYLQVTNVPPSPGNDGDVTMCIAAFRGRNQGFAWVSDIDMRRSYFRVKGTRKQCRVVRHYKTLYTNKGRDTTSYKSRLDQWLEQCSREGKSVLLTGHGLGGALATLGALEYANLPSSIMTITFGQPPVFVPAQYVRPGRLGKGPRKKHPCKHIDPRTYYQFVNSERFVASGRVYLFYDFIVYLQYFLYGMIDGETPTSPLDCLQSAANNTKQFLLESDEKGNLGSNFGSRYLLPVWVGDPGVSFLDISEHRDKYWEKRHRRKARNRRSRRLKDWTRWYVSFGNQGNYGVQYQDLIHPELLNSSSCTNVPQIHQMERYMEKIENKAPDSKGVPQSRKGFFELSRCNIMADCARKSTCHLPQPGGESICLGVGSTTIVGRLNPVRGRKPPAGDGGVSVIVDRKQRRRLTREGA